MAIRVVLAELQLAASWHANGDFRPWPFQARRYNFVDHPAAPISFYARFHCKSLRGRVMRGLGFGHGAHIERSVVHVHVSLHLELT